MVARAWTRFVLFLSSYSPLFLIFGFREWFENELIADGFFVLVGTSLLILVIFLRTSQSIEPFSIVVKQVTAKDAEMMGYIVTYLLPFLNISLARLVDAISVLTIMSVIAILYVHGNMVHINPVLNLIGFHLYDIQTADKTNDQKSKGVVLISKQSYVEIGSTIWGVPLGDYVILEKTR